MSRKKSRKPPTSPSRTRNGWNALELQRVPLRRGSLPTSGYCGRTPRMRTVISSIRRSTWVPVCTSRRTMSFILRNCRRIGHRLAVSAAPESLFAKAGKSSPSGPSPGPLKRARTISTSTFGWAPENRWQAAALWSVPPQFRRQGAEMPAIICRRFPIRMSDLATPFRN
jgi:hypothetical protein